MGASGPWQAGEVGPCEPHEAQQGQMWHPASGSGQSPAPVQAEWWTDQEQPFREGLGDIHIWKIRYRLLTCQAS